MNKRVISGLLTFALTASMAASAINVDAASSASKAKTALKKCVKKVALSYANDGATTPYYYNFMDINGDGIPEAIASAEAASYISALFWYDTSAKKAKKVKIKKAGKSLATLDFVYSIRKKGKDRIVVMAGACGEANDIVEYSFNKGKLVSKSVYESDYEKNKFKKDGKKIKQKEYQKYEKSVLKLKEIKMNKYSVAEADEIIRTNQLKANFESSLYSTNVSENFVSWHPEVKRYTVTLESYDTAKGVWGRTEKTLTVTRADGKDAAEAVYEKNGAVTGIAAVTSSAAVTPSTASVTPSAAAATGSAASTTGSAASATGAAVTATGSAAAASSDYGTKLPGVDKAVIGKFDLNSMKLLDMEEFASGVQEKDGSMTVHTTIRPSQAEVILPGFKFPGEAAADPQGFVITGLYSIDNTGRITSAEFSYTLLSADGVHYMGLAIPFAKYTFTLSETK